MCQPKTDSSSWWTVVPVSTEKALRGYKYKGQDLSLAYRYFLSPLAERCLAFIPRSMAPNLITFVGLLISLLGATTFCVLCPDWVSMDAPRWMFPFMGLCLFVYQTLDNIDGKQARRTGTGSALGLLFDHGCDAINATIGLFILLAIAGNAGFSLGTVALCVGNNVVPFFFATWEHYYTEEMVLPLVNGPSEGVLIGVALSIITYFKGPDLWQQELEIPSSLPLVGGVSMPLWQAMLGGVYLGIFATVAGQVCAVLAKERRKGASLLKPLVDTLPFFVLVGGLAALLLSDPSLFPTHPYLSVAVIGSLSTEMNVALMLAHMTGRSFSPYRLALVPLLLAAANATLLEDKVVSNATALQACSACAVLHTSVYVIKVVVGLRDRLGIFIFSVDKRKMT